MGDLDQGPVACEDDRFDHAILDLLLHDQPGRLWAEAELVRELGSRLAVEDALARLYGVGLIHRLREGFVFATRAAFRSHHLAA